MISEKQLLANQKNAQRSTGPRTAEGRAISSQNAIKHGLRAEQIVIIGESSDDYEQFSTELAAHLAPAGILESRLADQIAVALWKLQRAERMESDLLRHMQDVQQKRQQSYARQVLAAEKRIKDAKSVYDSVMQAANVSIHCVTFTEAQAAWLNTDDGRAFNENRWPVDHEYAKPMLAFNAFWDELDQKAREQLSHQAQIPSDPVNPPPSEPVRTDLSYQVMLEQNQKKAALQQNLKSSSPAGAAEDPSQQAAGPSEPIPLSMAIKDDFSGPNLMLKFSRYKIQFERSFYRALNELNKLQYLRKRSEAIQVQASEVSDQLTAKG